MGLEEQGHARLPGDVDPSPRHHDHAIEIARHDLADHAQERRAEVARHGQHQPQLVIAFRKAVEEALEAIALKERTRRQGDGNVAHGQIERHAGKPGLGHPLEAFLQRGLGHAGTSALHRPQGLVEFQPLQS